jgi:hypothetical protein
MRSQLDRTGFGWLEIDGERYEHDVLIRLDGTVEKRKKKLSKRVYGTNSLSVSMVPPTRSRWTRPSTSTSTARPC